MLTQWKKKYGTEKKIISIKIAVAKSNNSYKNISLKHF